jgi:hypothetical protein
MARIRSIKPEIAKHELLYETERATGFPIRFVWAVLPTACDREGRFKWRPGAMKTDILPYDAVDFEAVLNALVARGFLLRYRVGEEWYGWLPTFTTHQVINNRESESTLPPLDGADEVIRAGSSTSTRGARVGHASQGEGKGMEGKEDSSTTLRVAEPALLTFPTVGTGPKTWSLRRADVQAWEQAYPGLDILGECRRALAWVNANQPKTAKGMPAFLVNWFNRAVQRGGTSRALGSAGTGTASPVRTGNSRSADAAIAAARQAEARK